MIQTTDKVLSSEALRRHEKHIPAKNVQMPGTLRATAPSFQKYPVRIMGGRQGKQR
jgi:hypothetical protein